MSENTCEFYDIPCHFTWVQEEVKGFFVWVSEQIFTGILDVLNAIPIPSWVDSTTSFAAGISPGVWYFASVANLQFGAGVIASAYGIRFLIRRIPVIG